MTVLLYFETDGFVVLSSSGNKQQHDNERPTQTHSQTQNEHTMRIIMLLVALHGALWLSFVTCLAYGLSPHPQNDKCRAKALPSSPAEASTSTFNTKRRGESYCLLLLCRVGTEQRRVLYCTVLYCTIGCGVTCMAALTVTLLTKL
jgi:hypothetical protein